MRDRIISVIVIALLLVFTVIYFPGVTLGSISDVSIQGDSNSFTTSDLHALDYDLNYETYDLTSVVASSNIGSDEIAILNMTYLISSSNEYDEIIAVDAFTEDGGPMWISANKVNVRVEPDVSSESVCQVSYATSVTRVSFGECWSLVEIEEDDEIISGFVLSSYLSSEELVMMTPTPSPTPIPTATPIPTPTITPQPEPAIDPEITETEMVKTVYANCSLNLRSGPGTSYRLIKSLTYGTSINVVAITSNGWYKTTEGYYLLSSLAMDDPPVVNTPAPPPPVENGEGYSDFANYCLSFVGTPYVYTGSSPSGFDCSGYVMYIYANYHGISLPHNAASISAMGNSVDPSDIREGDVLCHDYNGDGIIDHVSLYIGNNTCVHASDSRRGVITSQYSSMGSVVTIRRFL